MYNKFAAMAENAAVFLPVWVYFFSPREIDVFVE
ncbi:hypothetical protein B23_0177 [Geobacillus thermoleovorans B23]|nr:hypothetical protein B23_0177 [Geobacillus thermoleovorans B23]